MSAQVAPSGECLRGDARAYLTGLLAAECHLYLAAYSPVLNLVVAVLHDRLWFNPCKVELYVLTVMNKDYYYFYPR